MRPLEMGSRTNTASNSACRRVPRRSSAWDAATPGRAIPWVAHADGGGLARLTPDGRDLVRRVDTGRWFLDLAADTSSSTFWAVDYLGGSLSRYDADGNRLARFPLDGARAVAVSPDGESVWDASFRDGRIERRTPSGVATWSEITGSHVEDILAAADGGVWTAAWFEGGIGEVRFYLDSLMVGEVRRLDTPRGAHGVREGPHRGRRPAGSPASLVHFGRRRNSRADGSSSIRATCARTGRGASGFLIRDGADSCIWIGTSKRSPSSFFPKCWGSRSMQRAEGSGRRARRECTCSISMARILTYLALAGRPVKVELLYEAEVR